MATVHEIMKKMHKGVSSTPTYHVWEGMIQRCTNPNNPSYPRYGGRGISVCPAWMVYANFLADMGERPDSLTIDRKDNDGNYEKSNCRWATRTEQNNNLSSNVLITLGEETQTISQWSRTTGIEVSVLNHRLNLLGWSVQRALQTPVSRKNVLHTVGDLSLPLNKWAERLGVTISTMYKKMKEDPSYLQTLVGSANG